MITRNPMQLKAFIKKKAAEKNISAQLVMQNYMLERLLERISLSTYKKQFYIKRRILNIGNCWAGYQDNDGSGYNNKRLHINP